MNIYWKFFLEFFGAAQIYQKSSISDIKNVMKVTLVNQATSSRHWCDLQSKIPIPAVTRLHYDYMAITTVMILLESSPTTTAMEPM